MARSAAKKRKMVLFLEVRFAAVAKMHNGAQNVPGRISQHKRLQTGHSLKIKRQKNQAEDHTKGNADTNTPQQRQFQTTRFSKPFERKEWTAQSRTVRSTYCYGFGCFNGAPEHAWRNFAAQTASNRAFFRDEMSKKIKNETSKPSRYPSSEEGRIYNLRSYPPAPSFPSFFFPPVCKIFCPFLHPQSVIVHPFFSPLSSTSEKNR